LNKSLDDISAEIENRLQQMTELHDFVDEMTLDANIDDPIIVCGDFNIFM